MASIHLAFREYCERGDKTLCSTEGGAKGASTPAVPAVHIVPVSPEPAVPEECPRAAARERIAPNSGDWWRTPPGNTRYSGHGCVTEGHASMNCTVKKKDDNGNGMSPDCGTQGAARWEPKLRLHRGHGLQTTLYSGGTTLYPATELRYQLRSGEANSRGTAGYASSPSKPRPMPIHCLSDGSRWTPRGGSERGARRVQHRSAEPHNQNFPT